MSSISFGTVDMLFDVDDVLDCAVVALLAKFEEFSLPFLVSKK
jgi:hypothetical protein